jgi:sugar O-acyltransferase (sialic acid O-acetyltransferase NeuD family)
VNEIVIFGSGGHSLVVSDAARTSGKFQINCYVDNGKQGVMRDGTRIIDEEYFAKESRLNFGVVAIGDNYIRQMVVEKILKMKPNFTFVTIIHPKAYVSSSAIISSGSVVMANATINPYAVVGNHVIINTNSSIDHECEIGNFSSIAPNAVLGGNCIVGSNSAIGIGSCLIHKTKIGKDSVIGASSLVLGEISNGVVAYGTPARVVRQRNPNDRYL